MRQILKISSQSPDARLALEVYIHRLVQTIGAMAATLGGLDGLVFTAGVARIRPESESWPARIWPTWIWSWTRKPTATAGRTRTSR